MSQQPVNASAKDMVLVTPDDTGDLANGDGQYPTAIVIAGTVGDIKVDTVGGSTLTIPGAVFSTGDRFPLSAKRIYSTSTTATSIYVLYSVG